MAFPPRNMQDFLALWRGLFPRDFTVPIEENAGGQGFDVPSQQAAQFARVSEAVNTTTQAYYIAPHSTQTAPPGAAAAPARCSLRVTRAAPVDFDLTLAEGVSFSAVLPDPNTGDDVEQSRYVLEADYTIPAGVLSVDVDVACSRVGYQGNTPPAVIDRFTPRGTATVQGLVLASNNLSDQGGADRLTPAMVGQFVRFISGGNAGTYPRRILSVTQGAENVATLDGDPLVLGAAANTEVEEFEDVGLTVEQLTPATGGVHGWLDASGIDRAVFRAANEPDSTYRERVRALPDVVSPGAIYRAAARVLTPLGLSFTIREARDPYGLFGVVWDTSPFDIGSLPPGDVLYSEAQSVRFFVVAVEIGGQGEFGAAYDAALSPGPAAWDVLFFDGYPVAYYSALAALWSTIESTRAAGVAWELVRDPSL